MENVDKDWISRRWQGEGNVVAPPSPKSEVDHEKLAKIADAYSETDLDGNTGRHCAECGIFDYLPTRCLYCNKHYCGEHADSEVHECCAAAKQIKATADDKRAPARRQIDLS